MGKLMETIQVMAIGKEELRQAAMQVAIVNPLVPPQMIPPLGTHPPIGTHPPPQGGPVNHNSDHTSVKLC